MNQALSIHIGLNKIDPKHYGGDGALKGCHNDAIQFQQLAKSQGFDAGKPMLDEDATAANVIKSLKAAAKKLKSGDSLLYTYSGHGSQVEDVNNGEEEDGLDETWCLYDRMLLDDELAMLWAKFKPGVRITVISDSCHSGSVTREIFRPPGAAAPAPTRRARRLPENLREHAVKDWAGIYRAIQHGTRDVDAAIKASVILISGCRDDQLSYDGDDNGLFTETLLEIWDSGTFTGSCRLLRAKVLARMPKEQKPEYSLVGAPNKQFESAPALRPAAGKPLAKETPARASATRAARRAGTRDAAATPIEIVIDLLLSMRYPNPTAGSNIKKWFSECEKIDKELALTHTRTDVFLEEYFAAPPFHGVALGKSELLKGKYQTPQDLANLAG